MRVGAFIEQDYGLLRGNINNFLALFQNFPDTPWEMTYAEQLQHPSWQRKRLEILQASNFRCAACDSTDNTLTAHHSYYEKGLMLWEYPDDALHCLCLDCHEERRAAEAALLRAVHRLSISKLKEMARSLAKRLNP